MNTGDVIDQVLEKEYSPTETTLSSTSSREKEFLLEKEILREREYFNGESLYLGYERVYGNNIYEIPATIFEQVELARHLNIVKLIGEQKVYHITGLTKQFPFATRYKVEIVQEILIRRELLITIPVPGKARSTIGLILLCTKDCSLQDIKNYLISFNAHDQLRLVKQEQRQKKRKSPEDVVKGHNKEVSRLSKLEKVLDGELDICTCDHAKQEHHVNCLVKGCACKGYSKKVKVKK